MDPVEGIMFQE